MALLASASGLSAIGLSLPDRKPQNHGTLTADCALGKCPLKVQVVNNYTIIIPVEGHYGGKMEVKSESGNLEIDLIYGGKVVLLNRVHSGKTMEYGWAFEQGGGNYILAIGNLGFRPAIAEISLWWQ